MSFPRRRLVYVCLTKSVKSAPEYREVDDLHCTVQYEVGL